MEKHLSTERIDGILLFLPKTNGSPNCTVVIQSSRTERYTPSGVVSLGWQAICENSAASGLLQLAASCLAAAIRVSLKGIYLSPRFAFNTMEAEFSNVEARSDVVVDTRVENDGNGLAESKSNPAFA